MVRVRIRKPEYIDLTFNPTHVPKFTGEILEPRRIVGLPVDDERQTFKGINRILEDWGTLLAKATNGLLTYERVNFDPKVLDIYDDATVEFLVSILNRTEMRSKGWDKIFRKELDELRHPREFIGAENGLQALIICGAIRTDFIHSDLDMPIMNAKVLLMAIKGIREVGSNTRKNLQEMPPVFIHSGGFIAATRDELIELGASGVGQKALTFEQHCAGILNALFGVRTMHTSELFEKIPDE